MRDWEEIVFLPQMLSGNRRNQR